MPRHVCSERNEGRGRKEPSSELLAAVVRALDLSLLDLTSSVAARLASSGRRDDVRLAA